MPSGVLPTLGLVSAGNSATDVRRQDLQTELDAVATGKTRAAREAKLQKACQGFEAIFINTILQEMRKSIPDDGLLPTSNFRRWRAKKNKKTAKVLSRVVDILW